MTPLISVITPTWRRHKLLIGRCIPSVQSQTWANIEHIVVSDGPDPALRQQLVGAPVVYGEVPTHDDSGHNWGSAARNHAYAMAKGDLVCYLDDDNAYRENHCDILARALGIRVDADFAYSQMMTHPQGNVIGWPPPGYGRIDTSLIMHRAGLLDTHGFWPLAGAIKHADQHAPDWGVVAQWLAAGAKWTHVHSVTVDYWTVK